MNLATLSRRLAGPQWRARLSQLIPVGVGLATISLSAYAALGLAGHLLTPRDYAAVGSVYLLISILGPGVFVAVEQQVNREVSGRIAVGAGHGPVPRTAALVSTGLALLLATALLVLAPILLERVFAGSWGLLVATVLAVLGAAATYVLRGMFAGQRRYKWYGASMAIEGLARALPCVVLTALQVTEVSWWGYVFALGLGLSALLTLPGLHPGEPGPEAPVARMSVQVGLLAGASGLTLVVANLGPVVLTSRLGSDPAGAAMAASFVSLFVLARIPILLFTPLQAVLLATLTPAVELGAVDAVRTRVRVVLTGVLGIGALGVLGAATLGPWAAELFFGAPIRLSALVAASLGLGTVGMMLAQVVQPALVALGRHRAATGAWAIGTLLFVAILLAPVEPLAAAVTAQAVAPAAVTALMLRALRRAMSEAVGGQARSSRAATRTRQ